MNQNQTILDLLKNSKTIAVVGFSSKPDKPGYYVPAYLQGAGYRIIPVNPFIDKGLGEKAYPDLKSIPDSIDVVQIFRKPEDIPPIVEESIEIGANGVWMQLGIINEEAAATARSAGLKVVMDACMKVEHEKITSTA